MNKILVLDDNKSIQLLYSDELTEEGYQVVTSGDGSRVMELIEKESPDLIVLDTRLGKYDGLDLLQQIRNTYNDLPVILCTAYPTFKRGLKSMAADYYVHKSSNLKELKLRVKMALEGERAFLSKSNRSRVHERESIPTKQITIEWSNLH